MENLGFRMGYGVQLEIKLNHTTNIKKIPSAKNETSYKSFRTKLKLILKLLKRNIIESLSNLTKIIGEHLGPLLNVLSTNIESRIFSAKSNYTMAL